MEDVALVAGTQQNLSNPYSLDIYWSELVKHRHLYPSTLEICAIPVPGIEILIPPQTESQISIIFLGVGFNEDVYPSKQKLVANFIK